uniref:Protein U94/rep n=1 Tax=Mastomys natalensis cytomegalovirus 1 TaxID=2973541 RepID=A0A9Y1IJK6_9BETA|nr:protein U94/rep [Mastomys natalensis cytomegalovirus 1]
MWVPQMSEEAREPAMGALSTRHRLATKRKSTNEMDTVATKRLRTSEDTVKFVKWLVNEYITDEHIWMKKNLTSYIIHNIGTEERLRSKRALTIARKYISATSCPIKFFNFLNAECVFRIIDSNPVYQILRCHGLVPRTFGTLLWNFLSGEKNALWLIGGADSGILEISNALAQCIPMTEILSGRVSNEDLAECENKIMLWWKDFQPISLRSDAVRSIITGTVTKLKIKSSVKTIKQTSVLICTQKNIFSEATENPEKEHIKAKTWKLNLARPIPRRLNSVCALDMKEFMMWLATIGIDDDCSQLLCETFDVTAMLTGRPYVPASNNEFQ